MTIHLTQEKLKHLYDLLEGSTLKDAANALQIRVETADVFIAGSGPIGSTFARVLRDTRPATTVLMAEIGSQDNPVIGAHHKNSIKYQKDIDAFVNVIKGALQPISQPPGDVLETTLAPASWAPPLDPTQGVLVIQGHNPNQTPGTNLKASAVTRTVGGMATHWTCACPLPNDEERVNSPLSKPVLDSLLERAGKLLNVHSDQYDHSIRHTVVREALKALPANRGVQNLPLAVQRRTDNPEFVTWTGPNTILGDTVSRPQFKLMTEARVTQLLVHPLRPDVIVGALVRNLNENRDFVVEAKAYVVACGAIGTPQVLFNSLKKKPPQALGRYLSEQSMTFCQIVLKREIVESIANDPRFKDRVEKHKAKYPNDPLPIPFNDPEPQVNIPYKPETPWHVQVHRDAFSYGDVGPKADPRVVVDLRFFGKSDISEDNRVSFGPEIAPFGDWEPGVTDIYGMPQATFHVKRSRADAARDQRMMKDMTDTANILGGFLPGSSPQFMEPGLALHITGTTRIGTNPATSVANEHSRVHGINNLWVGGNGVIPDATACNPTRTSVAYAIAAAEDIASKLGN